MNYIFIIIS